MERDTLLRTFIVGGLAAAVAGVLASVMSVRWLRGRHDGRHVTSATWMVFVVAVIIAGLSSAWLVAERAEKCHPGVHRTLCESPSEWLRHLP